MISPTGATSKSLSVNGRERFALKSLGNGAPLNGVEFMFWKDGYNGNGDLVAKWYRTNLMPDEEGRWARSLSIGG